MPFDPDRAKASLRSLSPAEIEEASGREYAEHERQVAKFKTAYAEGRCYLRGDDFHLPFSDRDLFNLTLQNEPKVQEAKRTNKSFAYVAKQRLQGRARIQTVTSPAESVPDIASRTEHKPRGDAKSDLSL